MPAKSYKDNGAINSKTFLDAMFVFMNNENLIGEIYVPFFPKANASSIEVTKKLDALCNMFNDLDERRRLIVFVRLFNMTGSMFKYKGDVGLRLYRICCSNFIKQK